MKKLTLTIAALLTLGLAACDKPTVVNVPAETVVVPVPGPAGEKGDTGTSGNQGATGESGATGETGTQGATGDQGVQGQQGETGGDTTIIVPQSE